MWRLGSISAAFAALCLVSQASEACAQNPQWQQYQRSVEQRRADSQRRYDQWGRQLDTRYSEWRAPANPTPQTNNDGISVRGLGIEPGQYNVKLPFGLNVRVNVPPDQRPQGQPQAVPTYVAGSVNSLADDIERSLRAVHYEVRRSGPNDLIAQIDGAIREIGAVRSLASQNASPQQLQQQFARFDELWHQADFELRNDKNAAPWLASRLEQIDRSDERLHQILRINPARGYDRVQVAALTSHLVSSVDHLKDDLQLDSRRDDIDRRLVQAANRALRAAAELNDSVTHDDPIDVIVREYEQFDEAWHGLVSYARGNDEISRHVWKVAQEVNQIDRELHELLNVDSPLAVDSQAVAFARSVAISSGNLLQLVRQADRGGMRFKDLQRETEDVAQAAEDLHQWMRQGAHSEEQARKRVQYLAQQWEDLFRRIQTIDDNRFPQLQGYANAVRNDLSRLQQAVKA